MSQSFSQYGGKGRAFNARRGNVNKFRGYNRGRGFKKSYQNNYGKSPVLF